MNPFDGGDTVDFFTPIIYFAFCALAAVAGLATLALGLFGVLLGTIGVALEYAWRERGELVTPILAVLIGGVVVGGVSLVAWPW